MSYNLRSKDKMSNTQATTPESQVLSQAEYELIQQKIREKDKQTREQLEAARAVEMSLREQLEQKIEESSVASGMNNLIETLTSEIKTLRQEFSTLSALRTLPNEVQALRQRVETIQGTLPFIRETTPTKGLIGPPLTTLNDAESRNPNTSQAPPLRNQLARDKHFNFPPPPETSENSPLRLKDLVDSIPSYDGRKIPLFQFCKACERARDLVSPAHETYLTQLVLAKLYGDAYIAVDCCEFSNINQLLFTLKQVFGPNKSLNQYRGELANTFMKHNDSIFDYIARIKELKSAIIDCELTTHGSLNDYTLYQIENDTLESFVNGLPPDLLVRVKLEGYSSLEDTFIRAIRIAKTMETETLRRKPSFASHTAPQPRKDIPPVSQPVQNPENAPTYQILRKPLTPFIKPLVPGQSGPNAPSLLECRYCKKPGHILANCRKLAFKNAQSSLSPNYAGQTQPTNDGNISGNILRVPEQIGVDQNATSTGRLPQNLSEKGQE